MPRLLDNFKRLFARKRKKTVNDQEEYRELIDNSFLGFFIIQNNQFKFMNKVGCDLIGYLEEELTNRMSLFDLVCEDDKEIAANTLNSIRESSKSVEGEFRVIRKCGDEIWIKALCSYSTYKGKKAITGSFIEYKERNLLKQQLQHSEERLRMTLEATQIGIWDWDIEKDEWYASPIYYTMLGYEPVDGQADRNEWMERVHPEDREEVSRLVKEVLHEGKKEYVYEARIRHANGEYRWQSVAGYVVNLNSMGNISRMLGIRRDIHDYKLTLDNLKKSKSRLRALFNTIPDLVWLKDPNGVFLQCNPRFEMLVGVPEQDIIGKTDYDFMNKEQADFFRQNDRDAILSGGPLANEEEVRFADGHVEILETIKTPIFESDGKLLGVVGIGRDITEKKRTELELDNYGKHLEQLVMDRTNDVNRSNDKLQQTNQRLLKQKGELQVALDHLGKTRHQLIQSEKMASLGVLAAGIAHEINNPLNFILGGTTGLEHYLKDHFTKHHEEVSPLLDIIKEGTMRASAIVRSLSHYSNNNDMVKNNCNIHSVIDNCLVMLHSQLRDKVEIVKDYTDYVVLVLGNEGKLHQVFLNILTNAEQAINGEGKITIKTRVSDNRVLITFTDTGAGMSEATKQKLFDPFYTTKEPGMGCGLGLSIVYNIVQEHGGALSFESELNVGTSAILSFPAAEWNQSDKKASPILGEA